MSLSGRWRIVEMDGWDQETIDLIEPAFIEFTNDDMGEFAFIAVQGWLDCRTANHDGRKGVEFTWDGNDEGDRESGRGWAMLAEDGSLEGHLFFHLGDDSGFRARPWTDADERRAQ